MKLRDIMDVLVRILDTDDRTRRDLWEMARKYDEDISAWLHIHGRKVIAQYRDAVPENDLDEQVAAHRKKMAGNKESIAKLGNLDSPFCCFCGKTFGDEGHYTIRTENLCKGCYDMHNMLAREEDGRE